MSKRIPFPYFYRVKEKIRKGNAYHKFGMIVIKNNAGAAVLAQEIAEEDFLMVRSHIPGVILGAIAGYLFTNSTGGAIGSGANVTVLEPWFAYPFFMIAAAFAGMAFSYVGYRFLWGSVTGGHRLMEYKGQMLEACWNNRYFGKSMFDEVQKATKQLSFYPQFEGVPTEDIEEGLWKQDTWCNKWLDDNALFVARKAKSIGMDFGNEEISLVRQYQAGLL